jgi:DNA polymerase-3 subunit epsilon
MTSHEIVGREISLDTETTGFKPQEGHRMCEIGCVEMINRVRTGKVFQVYINPKRSMPEPAYNVHGLSEHFLSTKPIFKDIAEDFLDFIGDSRLIIHNADFDMRFLNAELTHIKKRNIPKSQVFCTLLYARETFPGSPASLDALCRKYGIDNSHRDYHGALLDAELLADMYLELMGGSQVSMELAADKAKAEQVIAEVTDKAAVAARDFAPSDEEKAKHEAFVAEKIKNAMWGG